MKIVIDVPDTLLTQVRRAVSQGDYDDPREFIKIAIENQVQIESIDGLSGEVVTLEDALDSNSEPVQTDGNPVASLGNLSGGTGAGALGRFEYDMISTVSAPDPSRLDDGPLWGQFNRIFPVKLTLRALANDLRNQSIHASSQVDGSEDEWISLARFSDEVADLAREYGLKIQQVDREKSRARGEKLSAALPIGDESVKSKNRFKSHFVGKAEQNGDLAGATPSLSFVNIPENSRELIGVTGPGLEFAELWNPLLDGGVGNDQSLSDEERDFYIEHVQEHLPGELEAMRFAIESISGGHDRPDSLTSRIAQFNEEWSESHASTVRSGMVSRMFELGLLKRERIGQRGIAYRLTENGVQFLESEAND